MEPASVGRIVHLRTGDSDPLAALVTWAAADGQTVCLTVFAPDGRIFSRQMVQRGDGINQWSWPPRVSPPRSYEVPQVSGSIIPIDHQQLAREG